MKLVVFRRRPLFFTCGGLVFCFWQFFPSCFCLPAFPPFFYFCGPDFAISQVGIRRFSDWGLGKFSSSVAVFFCFFFFFSGGGRNRLRTRHNFFFFRGHEIRFGAATGKRLILDPPRADWTKTPHNPGWWEKFIPPRGLGAVSQAIRCAGCAGWSPRPDGRQGCV